MATVQADPGVGRPPYLGLERVPPAHPKERHQRRGPKAHPVPPAIDYYSRYLPAAYLTPSYSAMAAVEALAIARAEAERFHGPLERMPFLVTDNGST